MLFLFLFFFFLSDNNVDDGVDDVVGGLGGGEFRVLACADTGSETPLAVQIFDNLFRLTLCQVVNCN